MLRLTSNIMTSQTRKQVITIQILPNISRSKVNQRTKLCQRIKHTMRNIFLKNPYTNCGGETIPRPFSKKFKIRISLDQQSKAY